MQVHGKAHVLTQAKSNARITVQTIAALSEHGQVFPAVIHDRVDFAVAMTAIEIRPSSPAAAEAAELWRLTKELLGDLAHFR